MREHYDGLWLDSRNDVGATGARSNYRFGSIRWSYKGIRYVNERPVGVPDTGMRFTSEVRTNLPDEIGGVIWWSVDDATTSVNIPLYASGRTSPSSFATGDIAFDS
jgi:dipeptidase